MIWDAFLYGGEADMLECRLTEMDSLDCKFIIAESDITFQGKPKPLGFLENQDRFVPWLDRITYAVTALPDTDDPWVREYAQRDQLLDVAVHCAEPDDLIIFGDVDEIPRSDIKLSAETVLGMRHHQFAVDWVNPQPWCGSVINQAYYVRHMSGRHLRDNRWAYPVVPDAGWHLSWLGGVDAAKAKAHSFSHTEFTGKVCRWLDEGHCYSDGLVWDDNQELTVQQVYSADPLPRWIGEGKCPDSWWRW